jgi:uncharacterized protein YcfJ
MNTRTIFTASALALASFSLAACQTASTTTGAVGGAVAGAAIGGPVGAVAGGVAGAAAGAAISPDETARAQRYVVTQRRPSVRISDEVDVGYRLPPRVATYRVPADVGLSSDYDYTIVNDRRVLVEPTTREVVYVYD